MKQGMAQQRSGLVSLLMQYGGRSSVGRARDCDSRCRGFDPLRPPHIRKAPDLTVWRLFCFSGSSIPRLQVLGRKAGRFVVFMCLDDAALPAGPVRRGGRQGDDWRLLLYIEGSAQSPGAIGCICHRGEAQQCLRTDKLPAVFLPVSSRVTS